MSNQNSNQQTTSQSKNSPLNTKPKENNRKLVVIDGTA